MTHPTVNETPGTVRARYEQECARLGYEHDPAQARIVALLDDLRERLLAARPRTGGLVSRLLGQRRRHAPVRGLYLWGGVGRGKTWLMDLFFHSLPLQEKQRSHFHRFMQFVHEQLKLHRERADPLEAVAERIARQTRVLCFDEFFVNDIADAMLLGNLLRGLFARGVTLVATSNIPPAQLYKDGLQRARFLPAIHLLETHTEVVHIEDGADYRLRRLERAPTWFDAAKPDTNARLERLFTELAGTPGKQNVTLTINHRTLRALREDTGIAWFDFATLCVGPRSQEDYIELARCYHTVLLSDIPLLTEQHENPARRFIALVDEFYDRGVKLIASAYAPVAGLYAGTRLVFEFERTRSRLTEMQSHAYLARAHRP